MATSPPRRVRRPGRHALAAGALLAAGFAVYSALAAGSARPRPRRPTSLRLPARRRSTTPRPASATSATPPVPPATRTSPRPTAFTRWAATSPPPPTRRLRGNPARGPRFVRAIRPAVPRQRRGGARWSTPPRRSTPAAAWRPRWNCPPPSPVRPAARGRSYLVERRLPLPVPGQLGTPRRRPGTDPRLHPGRPRRPAGRRQVPLLPLQQRQARPGHGVPLRGVRGHRRRGRLRRRHGPGELHVARQEAGGRRGADDTVVNPARLEPRASRGGLRAVPPDHQVPGAAAGPRGVRLPPRPAAGGVLGGVRAAAAPGRGLPRRRPGRADARQPLLPGQRRHDGLHLLPRPARQPRPGPEGGLLPRPLRPLPRRGGLAVPRRSPQADDEGGQLRRLPHAARGGPGGGPHHRHRPPHPPQAGGSRRSPPGPAPARREPAGRLPPPAPGPAEAEGPRHLGVVLVDLAEDGAAAAAGAPRRGAAAAGGVGGAVARRRRRPAGPGAGPGNARAPPAGPRRAGGRPGPAPRHEAALADAARLAAAAGDRASSAVYLRRVLAVDPWSVASHAVLADLLAADGDWGGVLAECRAALRVDPTHLEAHALLARALAETGDRAGAAPSSRS